MVTIELVHDSQGLAALEQGWRRLEEAVNPDCPFLSYDWQALWWRHFGHGQELRLLVALEGPRLIGIAPVMASRQAGLTTVQFLGRGVTDYAGFLLAPGRQDCAEQFITYMQRNMGWDGLDLLGVPEDSAHLAAFQAAWHGLGRLSSMAAFAVAPYLRVSGSWEDYYKTLSKSLRSDTGRQLRRLQERGRLDFYQCRDVSSASRLLEGLFHQKEQRLTTTGGRSLFRDRRMQDFYRDVVRTIWPRGRLDLSSLSIDDDVISLHLGFVFGGTYFYYMPSFNPKYAAYSPGRLLLYHLVRSSFERGLERFDLMAGGEQYKYDWAREERRLYRLTAYRNTPRGRALWALREVILPRLRRSARARSLVRWGRRLRASWRPRGL